MLSSKEREFSKLYGSKHCLFTGNATTALYLTLKSLNLKKNSEIMIPNSACQHVPLAIILAGYKPNFVDIDQNNFGLYIPALKKKINKKVKVIIAIHAYGIKCEIEKISSYCKKKNIFLIEDAALLIGSKNKEKLKYYGDVAVFSFGKGKLINFGEGGALITNNTKIYLKLKKLEEILPFKNNKHSRQINNLNYKHTKIYNKYFLKGDVNKLRISYKKIVKLYAKNLIFKLNKNYFKKINLSQLNMNKLILERYKKIFFLKKKLSQISKNFFYMKSISGTPWRMNIFFYKPEIRNYVLKDLIKNKIKVSSWHPSLDIFFYKRLANNNNFPKSDKISSEIMNFWINNEVNKNYLNKVVNNLKRIKKEIL